MHRLEGVAAQRSSSVSAGGLVCLAPRPQSAKEPSASLVEFAPVVDSCAKFPSIPMMICVSALTRHFKSKHVLGLQTPQ